MKYYLFGVLVMAGLFFNAGVSATTYSVPQEYSTVQAAIDVAIDGDIIELAEGQYDETMDYLGKAITVRACPDCLVTFEYCHTPVVIMQQIQSGRAILEGIVFEDNDTSQSVVDIDDSSATIRDCLFISSVLGGFMRKANVLDINKSDVELIGCVLKDNAVDREYWFLAGRGIYSYQSTVTLMHCAIIDSYHIEPFYCRESNLYLSGCLFEGNRSVEAGGVLNLEKTSAYIYGCRFLDNYSSGAGGAIYSIDSNLCVMDSRISENTAREPGGGISCRDGSLRVYRSEISGNRGKSGGGIRCKSTVCHLVSSQVINNNATSLGVGLACKNTETTIINCLITGNDSSLNNSSIDIQCTDDSALPVTIQNSTIVDNKGGLYLSHCGQQVITNCILHNNSPNTIMVEGDMPDVRFCNILGGYPGEGNIDSDPLFVNRVESDYRLMHLATGHSQDSPCIDSGRQSAWDTVFLLPACLARMSEFSTRTDGQEDSLDVDMGYHESGPSFHWGPEIEIIQESNYFDGDIFAIEANISHAGLAVYSAPLAVAIELGGMFYWWPTWSQTFEYRSIDLPAGVTPITVVPPVTLSLPSEFSVSSIRTWSAVLTPDLASLWSNLVCVDWEVGG